MTIENRLRDMHKTSSHKPRYRQALLVLSVALALLASACSSSADLSQPNESAAAPASTPEEGDAAEPAASQASLTAIQGRWLLIDAPGFEESHGSTMAAFDGPELGDRYIKLEMHGSCIDVLDYTIAETVLTTQTYFGDRTGEECIDPPIGALFEPGSDFEIAVTDDTLMLSTDERTLGFVHIELFADVSRAPVAIRDASGEDGAMEALFIGTLEIGESCTYVVGENNDGTEYRMGVVFSSQQTMWDYENNVLLGNDGSGAFTVIVSGDQVEIGGGSIQIDVDALPWVIPPFPTCDTTHVWFASTIATTPDS